MNATSTCPECGVSLAGHDKFCGGCGSEVGRCASCGAVGLVSDRFCAECGHEFRAATGRSNPSNTPTAPAGGTGRTAAADSSGGTGSDAPTAPSERTQRSPWDDVIRRLAAATIGEYEIIRELGRGGMAAVFLAHEIALNRKVAIKVMSPGIMTDEGMIDRFQQEAVTVANLSHAHIVSVHAVREIDDLHFFVMKYIEGRALDGVIAAEERLSLPVVRALLAQVGSALSYAHRRGVIHRDVKPANILLGADGDAFVTDFGIAKVVESPSRTQTGAVPGTAAYMSPEQCYAMPLTPATDQYSLGIVAYEMIAGRKPFVGSSSFALMHAHITEQVPPLRSLRPDCPADVDEAILRMLAKKVEDRWPSIPEALTALRALPVMPGDPVLEEIGKLANAGASVPLRDLFKTPMSPVPASRPQQRRRGAPSSSPPSRPVEPLAISIGAIDAALEPGDKAPLRVMRIGGEDPTGLVPSDRIQWASTSPSVATVDAAGAAIVAVSAGVAVITASLDTATASLEVNVAPARPASIRITASGDALAVGEELHVTATVADKHGKQLARSVKWTTTDPHVASVSGHGVIRAIAVGRVGVIATCDSARSELGLTIAAPPVVAVQIRAERDTIAIGDTLQVRATALDARGHEVEGRRIVWSTPSKTLIRVTSSGVVTATAAGDASVVAECDGHRGTLNLMVTQPHVSGVEIAPVHGEIAAGKKVRLKARVLGADGRELARAVEWRSSDVEIATVSSDGVVTPKGPGRVRIIAESGGCDAHVDITIGAPAAAPIVVAQPAVPSRRWIPFTIGGSLAAAALIAVAVSQMSGTDPETQSDGGSVITGKEPVAAAPVQPDPAPVPPAGEPKSAAPNDPRTAGGANAGTTPPPAAAVASVTVDLPEADRSIEVGSSVQLSAVAYDASRKRVPARQALWTSVDPAVARVGARTGEVVGLSPGTARIRAHIDGRETEVTLTVTPALVRQLAITGRTRIELGDSTPLSLIAHDARGAVVPNVSGSWESDTRGVADVDPATGWVRGRGVGISAIRASIGDVSTMVTVTVAAKPEPPKPDPVVSAPTASGLTIDAMAAAEAKIKQVVEEYASALTARNAGRVESAYRAETGTDRSNLDKLLGLMKDRDLTLMDYTIASPKLESGQVVVDLTARFRWKSFSGARIGPRPVVFRAVLEPSGASDWRLVRSRIVGTPDLR